MTDYYMPDKLFDKIKEIAGTGKFDDTKTFIDMYNKFSDDITLKNVFIFII